MEKINEELKRKLVFHSYGRFAPIQNIINENRAEKRNLKILDVGGRGNYLQQFLPEDEVFYLDPFVESNDKNFIKGDGCSMPLENESFDWVVSTDVFEHIPDEKRSKFLEENLRVAKKGVILAAPFFSKEVAQAELNANEVYKTIAGKEHIWLKEHIENGLPREDVIESFLKEKNLEFQKINNNALFLWQALLEIEFIVGENALIDIQKDVEDFNYFYNSEVFPYDSVEPSYRKIYFIKKEKNLVNYKVNKKLIEDVLFLEVMKKSLNLLAKISAEKTKWIIKNEAELQDKNDQIFLITSSKFWKLRDVYMKMKSIF